MNRTKRIDETAILARFLQHVTGQPDRPALLVKRSGGFQTVCWEQIYRDVQHMRAVLSAAGVAPGHHVAQLAENRYEWIVADLAIAALAAVHVPLHTALSSEQVAEQIQHSRSAVVLVSTKEQVEKLLQSERKLTIPRKIFSYEPCDAESRQFRVEPIDTAAVDAECMDEPISADGAHRDRLATILYTSGTTGQPKGVMLTHGNLADNAAATAAATGEQADDLKVGFLPLSHVYARTCDLYTWITLGNRLALAESRETVMDDCRAVRPTWLNGVPAFYERQRRTLLAAEQRGEPTRLREMFGGAIRSGQCGGAALSDDLFDFYWQHNVPLFAGYGLTEASPVVSVSNPTASKRGAVGRPIAGVEARATDDGELLVRGRGVMTGYWQAPEETAAAIQDGWLHTGDLVHIDEDEFLHIIGRKKDVLVLSSGFNVVPTAIENRLIADPRIEQALVVGDDRPFLSALIVPRAAELRHWIGAAIAGERPFAELVTDPAVIDRFKSLIDAALFDLSRYEQVRQFVLLPDAFSFERGHVTPKLSLRREAIIRDFRDVIQRMYNSDSVDFPAPADDT